MDIIQATEELTLFCLYDEFMKSIIDVDEGGLSSLKSFTVSACTEIVFMMDAPACGAPAILANLDKLHLKSLDNMEDICRLSLPKGSLHKLKVLNVEHCRMLGTIVTGLMLPSLLSLEEIQVYRCDKVTNIFGHIGTLTDTETVLLSNLRKFSLMALPKLNAIWSRLNPDSPAISLKKLTEVEIYDCRKLKYIFPSCIAESLMLLQVLKLEWCLDLKSIITKETQGLSLHRNQPVYFSKLRVIEVKGCKKLKSLFSVAEAQNLGELKAIKVGTSSGITELISHDEKGGAEMNDSIILLPKLSSIEVIDLSSMNRLCAKSFTVDLPSLEDLVIVKCPKLESNVVDFTKLGLEDLPLLKQAQIGEQRFCGEAIKQLFPDKGNSKSKEGNKPLELQPLLKRG